MSELQPRNWSNARQSNSATESCGLSILSKESVTMNIENIVDDILWDLEHESGNGRVEPDAFIKRLESCGFMIVPIEDPTNLFGIQEDSL